MRAPRWAVALTLTTLFFAGASLSAVAGDEAAQLFDGDAAVAVADAEAPAATETETLESASVEVATVAEEEPGEVALEPEPAPEPAPAPSGAEPESPETPEPVAPAVEVAAAAPEAVVPEAVEAEPVEPQHAHGAPAPVADQAPDAEPATPQPAAKAPAAKVRPAPVDQRETRGLDPEASADGVNAVVWLHRQLPDPTPPSLRLTHANATRLVMTAGRADTLWELALGVLRSDGSRGPLRARSVPDAVEAMTGARLDRNGWALALAATGRTAAADRAIALARYYRAVGFDALVNGLLAQQDELAAQVAADERIVLYAGGRNDVLAGRVDVRVLALVAYLAETYGQVTVSSLIAGHRLYSRPGVVSAHVYGQAVDIASLGGMPIVGNQEPGGLTERAVRDILLLPAEVRPRQLISLLGLGGPSFPLADHEDHIHVGF